MFAAFLFHVDGVPEDIVVETLDEIVLDGGGFRGAVKSPHCQQAPRPFVASDVVPACLVIFLM